MADCLAKKGLELNSGVLILWDMSSTGSEIILDQDRLGVCWPRRVLCAKKSALHHEVSPSLKIKKKKKKTMILLFIFFVENHYLLFEKLK